MEWLAFAAPPINLIPPFGNRGSPLRIITALCCLALLWPGAAHAKWLKASSEHFVVYADDSEKDIRRFSTQLERYHSAMELVTQAKLPPPSPSSRVTIYVVSGKREVRELYGEGSKYIGGFYVPRAGGSLAIVPRVRTGGRTVDFSMITLLHEYAHHFMTSASAFALPRWLSEGSAEFFSSASFDKDGGIAIGRPAQHRAGELYYAADVNAEQLLDADLYEKTKGKNYDAFYGKSWLLYHYLAFNEERQGQMRQYVLLLTQGKAPREAALEAFGDFDQLEKELDKYLGKRRMFMLKLEPSMTHVGPIEVRELSKGAAAMMPVRVRSRRGVDEEQASQLVGEARAIAAEYPNDPFVLSALAETEFDAGNDQEAIAAADAALAIDPGQVNAYVQKGYALFRMAEDADDQAAAYALARKPFVALNHLENDHPLPLVYYYQSYVEQGAKPTPLAVKGLEWASQLAPFDLGLRMMVATQELRDGKPEFARINLTPIAYNPHGGAFASVAQAMLERIDADPDWDGSDVYVPEVDGE